MKWPFLFVAFCFLSLSVKGQTGPSSPSLVVNEQVPAYLKAVINSGKVTINGEQKIAREPIIIPFQKKQVRDYSPAMMLHPQAVIYLGARIFTRPEQEATCFLPPNIQPFMFGVRGGAADMGGPTAEQTIIGTSPTK